LRWSGGTSAAQRSLGGGARCGGVVRVSGGALVEDEVRRRAGDPSYRAAATLACAPGFGKPASVSAEIAGFSCARGKTGLTVGPGCQWSRATRGESGRAERSTELGCGCGPRASGRVRLGVERGTGRSDWALRVGLLTVWAGLGGRLGWFALFHFWFFLLLSFSQTNSNLIEFK